MVLGKTTSPIFITGTEQSGLLPLIVPPPTLCRVVPGFTWSQRAFRDWLKYSASRNAGGTLLAPKLGRDTASHIYVTDEASLDGILSPTSITNRLGLSNPAQTECMRYGCVIIRFTISDPTVAIFPPLHMYAAQQGLTVNGAREWLIPNIRLDRLMDVMYVGVSPYRGRPFWYDISLTDQ